MKKTYDWKVLRLKVVRVADRERDSKEYIVVT